MAGRTQLLGHSNTRHIFGTAKVGNRGQIVIPKEARGFYKIKPGDTLLILGDEESGMIVTCPEVFYNLANQIIDQMSEDKTDGKAD